MLTLDPVAVAPGDVVAVPSRREITGAAILAWSTAVCHDPASGCP